MAKTKVTAADIRVLLHEKYSDHRQFAYAEEVGNATGLEQTRRLDAVVVNVYKSKGYSVEGIEIKVSRADLRRELQDSSKHNVFFDSLDYYSLAAPSEIIDMSIIPPKWGIYSVVGESGNCVLNTMRKPLSLHDEKSPAIDRPFFACLMRALCNQTPTATAIEAARIETAEKIKKEYEWRLAQSDQGRIEKLQEELKAIGDFRERLRLWGVDSIERGIDKYEAITKVDLSLLDYRLKNLVDGIKEVRAMIPDAQKWQH